MAATQEAEIIFAQKLASNEKPIRSKALLKLRKYISVRSERGGFSEVELLKIWKGLFYCLWMQDMPLLQEELSSKISALLHSFRTIDSQLLYFKTFLLTVKREWNGIDRLRLDKFFQLVRFFFREVFEMLRRQDWKSSLVNDFLQLISEQLLQSSSSAPSGLILHILDLYMSELAVIGSDTLTAEQNLTFIEPFCKTLAKTKDRVMLKAIGSNIFNTIVDQVPYAIEDLLREIQECSSENDTRCCEDHMGVEGDDDDDDDEDQEKDHGLMEDMKHGKSNGECGPVLQFDYGAIADRLFQLASHTNIPSFNRSKIYKFVKIFRDLAEGFFPQDEIEEVSTDDEDEDDNRRSKKKKKRSKKQTDKAEKISETTAESDPSQDCKQEKKKKRKKKRSKSVEDQTGSDTNRPAEDETSEISHNNAFDEKDSSDHGPVKEDGECGAEADTNIDSILFPSLQKKKRKLKKKKMTIRDINNRETTDDVKQENLSSESDITSASEHISRDGASSSDPITPAKKRKLKKKNTSDIHHGEETDDVKQEENCISTVPEPKSREEPSSSDPMKPLKKRKTKGISTDEQAQNKMTVRKSQRVRGVKSEAEESDENQTNTCKKKKKKLTSVELSGDTTEHTTRKRNMINGHTDTGREKRPKTLSDEGFLFSEKKSPTALFCRSTRTSRRRQIITTPNSETKKVTFGLKNNQTMEFRKMDKSSLVSPAGPSRVAFDPKKTPKSGVLKSPTSSPAIRKRLTAADFF